MHRDESILPERSFGEHSKKWRCFLEIKIYKYNGFDFFATIAMALSTGSAKIIIMHNNFLTQYAEKLTQENKKYYKFLQQNLGDEKLDEIKKAIENEDDEHVSTEIVFPPSIFFQVYNSK